MPLRPPPADESGQPDDPEIDVPVAGLAARSRFCRQCGDRWQAHWLDCPSCEQRAQRATAFAALPRQREGPSVTSALTLYFTLLGASTIGILSAMGGAKELEIDFGVTIAHSAIVLAWCAFAWRDVLPALTPRVPPWWFLVAVGGAVVTFGFAFGVIGLFHKFAGMPVSGYTPAYFNGGYGWGTIILMVAVQPGIFEELGFRGVVQSAIGRILAPREAIVVSAMLFMTLHLSPANFPHTFVIGLALGYMRYKTGSMLPGMLLHFTHNLLCVVTEQVAP